MQDPLTVAFGAFTLDTVKLRLSGPKGETQLSPLATRLVVELARKPGETVERATLIVALWRDDPVMADAALSRLVSEARQAVGDDPKNPTLIQTVPRRGYRLIAVSPAGPPPTRGVARAIEKISYGKLAAIGILIIFITIALKLIIDALVPILGRN